MSSGRSDRPAGLRMMPNAIKILVAGGFGVGKTTFVSAISETRPLRTEEILTDQSVGVDDLSGVEGKNTTTVAMDFGRITIRDEYVLYLFGTPGQKRFWFMWDELSVGALGAVVLADTRRLAECFPSVDYFERRGTPFIVAVNCFEGAQQFKLGEVELALNLGPNIPVMLCDARSRESAKDVLITLVRHAMSANSAPAGSPATGQARPSGRNDEPRHPSNPSVAIRR